MGREHDEADIKEKMVVTEKMKEADGYCPEDLSNFAYSKMKEAKLGAQQDSQCLQKLPTVDLVDNSRAQDWAQMSQQSTEYNKDLFAQVDLNKDGRLGLKELMIAVNDPDSDLSSYDRNKLIQAGKTEMSRYAALGSLAYLPGLSGVVDITLPEFLRNNREVY